MKLSQSNYLWYQEEGRAKARENNPLHLAGCMLYWAEGAKSKSSGIAFANSDPNMLLLFMRFLREEMQVKDEIIRMRIQCHTRDPIEIKRIERYWLDLLDLPSCSLRKTLIKKGNPNAIRHNNFENGFCMVEVYRVRLLHHIFGAIQEYSGFDNPAWRGEIETP